MGIVEAVGSDITGLAVGDRVVVPFNISCGHCFMCGSGLQSQCEVTQVHEHGTGASLFGYTKLYGQVPGGQAEYLRVPHADYGPIKVPDGPPDDRFVYLSDVLPTAWQAVEYADIPDGGSVAVVGLGPIGDMACRVAMLRGATVFGIDRIPERLARVQHRGVHVMNLDDFDTEAELVAAVRDRTYGRGPDAVIDAVGMEAHGSPITWAAQQAVGVLPSKVAEKVMTRVGSDRMAALLLAIELVRRGGTLSIVGVYGGMTDPMPMMKLFDKQIQIRMGQANVRRWVDDLLPLVGDDDPLGLDTFATHHLPLASAPEAYRMFQQKDDGAVKVVFRP